ncbi:hypothetical protein [Nocardia fluminea]|uniref:hypothetical protein n=1 Tax=Nocardia fluminea TaxID=134984 RepID=UPI000C70A479|nr:hypothetical protein [Nocardia fluminea]
MTRAFAVPYRAPTTILNKEIGARQRFAAHDFELDPYRLGEDLRRHYEQQPLTNGRQGLYQSLDELAVSNTDIADGPHAADARVE